MRAKSIITLNYQEVMANAGTGQTSLTYIYAGGDIVSGAATVIEAMGAGKKAAKAIDKNLSHQ